jgi:hypothetical protein
MNTFNAGYGMGAGAPSWIHSYGPLLALLLLWSLFWKGLALWHAARRGSGHPWWFILLLVINTAGILEIIYLFAVLRLKLSQLFSK